jgi:hypothetical protein
LSMAKQQTEECTQDRWIKQETDKINREKGGRKNRRQTNRQTDRQTISDRHRHTGRNANGVTNKKT